MKVIRPAYLAEPSRLRRAGLGLATLGGGLIAAVALPLVASLSPVAVGVAGLFAALGLGVGTAWLWRALRPDPERRLLRDLESVLGATLDDAYTLILRPRLPDKGRGLAAVLVGPAGVRVLTARDWHGRYRVRGRAWHYDAGRLHGWIPCRTNPSFDSASATERVARWAADTGMPNLAIGGAVAFPNPRSRIVLEEPEDEIITADNVPWWANRIGRVQRLDAASAARFVAAVLDAGEADSPKSAEREAA